MEYEQAVYEYAINVLSGALSIEEVPIMFRGKAQEVVSNPDKALGYTRDKKWAEIKHIRNVKESSGCPFKGKVLDSDERSVIKLNSAVQSAQVYGKGFSIDWTMQDNSVVTLTYEDMLAIPLALASWSNYLHQHARTLREQIEAANNVGEIMAIEWGEDNYTPSV